MMKKNKLGKLLAVAAALTFCLSSAGIPAAACEMKNTQAEAPFATVEQIDGGTVIFVDAPAPDIPADTDFTQKTLNADSADSEFLGRCKGISWGYQDIANYSSGQELVRSIYKGLYDYGEYLWNCKTDIPTVDIKYSTTDSNGNVTTRTRKGLTIIKPSVTMESSKELRTLVTSVYFMFRHDNPVFYFYGTVVVAFTDGSIGITVADNSYLSASSRAAYQTAIKNYLVSSEKLVHNDYTRTDYQNALELYKKLMNTMEYAPNGSSDQPYFYTVLGGIYYHTGVCESYARIYNLMLNYHGIDNILITGRSHGEDHGWNLLKLDDGKYYFADATWDDKGSANDNDNRYFAKGTTVFYSDHTIDTPNQAGGDYLYKLPQIPSADFDPNGSYKATNHRLADYNKDGELSNFDIRALQNTLTNDIFFNKTYDVNNDGKMNNRDLKALQKLIESLRK